MKAKTKKKKPLKAAEARKMVDELAEKVAEMGLALHKSDQLLQSMTGARDNCQMMYKHETAEREKRDLKIAELNGVLQERQRVIGELNSALFARDEKLRALKGETAGQLLKRGFGLFFRNLGASLKRLIGR